MTIHIRGLIYSGDLDKTSQSPTTCCSKWKKCTFQVAKFDQHLWTDFQSLFSHLCSIHELFRICLGHFHEEGLSFASTSLQDELCRANFNTFWPKYINHLHVRILRVPASPVDVFVRNYSSFNHILTLCDKQSSFNLFYVLVQKIYI